MRVMGSAATTAEEGLLRWITFALVLAAVGMS